jgi:hypothetical protein
MASLEDRARRARNLATETFGSVSRAKTKDLANQNAKAAGKKLTPAQEKRATDIMQTRRQNDRDRTAARAKFIAGPNSPRAKRADAAAMAAGVTGSTKAKPKATAKATAKATPKPTAKATTKPMTASERAFIKNQKEKAKATKRTGVYPNTAN